MKLRSFVFLLATIVALRSADAQSSTPTPTPKPTPTPTPTSTPTPTQSTTLSVSRVQDYKQTSPSAPVPVQNPFTQQISADASPFTITSATVNPPSGSVITLIAESSGVFSFTSVPFPSDPTLTSTYPAGAYSFTVQLLRGGTINGIVNLGTASYPTATLTNREWTAGTLQFDPGLDFDLSWTDSSNVTDITLTVSDPTGNVIYTANLTGSDSFATIPANTLQDNVPYSAQLRFAATQVSTSGSVKSQWSYAAVLNFTLSPVDSPPGLITPAGFTIIPGQPMVYQLLATSVATYNVSTLPPGLNFDPATGIVFGIPSPTPSPSPIQYTVGNAAGINGGTVNLSIPSPTAGPTFVNSTSITGHVGAPFAFQIVTNGASTAARFSAANLPDGLSIDSLTGLISGTATTAESDAVNITVVDGQFTRTSNLQLTFVGDPILPYIISARRVRVYPGQPFSYQITADSGPNRADAPDFKLLGQLPAGLSFDAKTGIISGTFGGAAQRNGDPPDEHFLNDNPIVQLAATNTHGTGTSPLVFLAAPTGTVNLSTRILVGSGDDVLIGGFIVTGNASESVLLRAIGPSLPVANALQDPVLELHLGNGAVKTTNDNWKDTQSDDIENTGAPPKDDRESAILETFQPANFTAVVRGKNGATGVGLVELYDLGTQVNDTAAHAKLAQISTRGTVHTGDDVMIGGFIIQGPATKTLLRGIGPELATSGVIGALQDPILELHDGSGTTVATNDDWQDDPTQAQAIKASGVAPSDGRESAFISTLNPGSYTAVLRGKDNTTGIALVEVYSLQ